MELLEDRFTQEEKRLQGRISDLVVTTTRQLLKSTLSRPDQQRLIDKQIKSLGELS